jgi:hypothetical protein
MMIRCWGIVAISLLSTALSALQLSDGTVVPDPRPPTPSFDDDTALGSDLTVSTEIAQRGPIPMVRVVVGNRGTSSADLGRVMDIQVLTAACLTARSRLRFSDLRPDTLIDVPAAEYQAESLVCLRVPLNRNSQRVTANGTWMIDRELNPWTSGIAAGPVLYRVLFPRWNIASRWRTLIVRDKPADPITRFDGTVRVFDSEAHYRRQATAATSECTVRIGPDQDGLRIATLVPEDPLRAVLPRLTIIGKTFHVLTDGRTYRLALAGVHADGSVDDEARVMAALKR